MSTCLPTGVASSKPADAAIAPDAALIAIDVGGTTTRVGALTSARTGPMVRVPSRDLGADPVRGLATATRAAVPAGKRLAGVVVGLPVSFDAATRVAMSSPNLPGFEGRAIGEELGAALGVPTIVDRDTVLLATGEWAAGAGERADLMLGVFIGTGIGGAMLVRGAPYRGASGGAAEVGHVPIRDHGRPCVCGNTDCLEAYASGHVIEELAANAGVPLADVFTHEKTQAGVADYVAALGHGLAAAVNMFDPHVLVIGGGLYGRPSFPAEPLARAIRARLRAPVPREHVKIRSATLGSEAALAAAPILFARHAST